MTSCGDTESQLMGGLGTGKLDVKATAWTSKMCSVKPIIDTGSSYTVSVIPSPEQVAIW